MDDNFQNSLMRSISRLKLMKIKATNKTNNSQLSLESDGKNTKFSMSNDDMEFDLTTELDNGLGLNTSEKIKTEFTESERQSQKRFKDNINYSIKEILKDADKADKINDMILIYIYNQSNVETLYLLEKEMENLSGKDKFIFRGILDIVDPKDD